MWQKRSQRQQVGKTYYEEEMSYIAVAKQADRDAARV